jgi:hypothetical protein
LRISLVDGLSSVERPPDCPPQLTQHFNQLQPIVMVNGWLAQRLLRFVALDASVPYFALDIRDRLTF